MTNQVAPQSIEARLEGVIGFAERRGQIVYGFEIEGRTIRVFTQPLGSPAPAEDPLEAYLRTKKAKT